MLYILRWGGGARGSQGVRCVSETVITFFNAIFPTTVTMSSYNMAPTGVYALRMI